MPEQEKYRIVVQATPPNNGGKLYQVEIGLTSDSLPMDIEEVMHTLCSAVSLCIKGSAKEGVEKDHELLKAAIDHLQTEFVSTVDFEEAEIFGSEKLIINKKKED